MLTVCAEDLMTTCGYTPEEQKTFPYLAEFMSVMRRAWPQLQHDEEACRRFLLASLYLTYRACLHQGVTMSTRELPCGEIHRMRLRKWLELTGEEIESSDQYLWMIGCDGQPSLISRPGPYLVMFVLSSSGLEVPSA